MRRVMGALAASALMIGSLAAGMGQADAAGIVTHAWMATDAIDRVSSNDLHVLLDAHRDQVRAGVQFPDGGYYTRGLGTPGGDYGEEAHWQRFVDAYIAQMRADPNCGDLTRPTGRKSPERPVRGDRRPPPGRRSARDGRRGLGLDVRAERTRLRRVLPSARVHAIRRTWWPRAADGPRGDHAPRPTDGPDTGAARPRQDHGRVRVDRADRRLRGRASRR